MKKRTINFLLAFLLILRLTPGMAQNPNFFEISKNLDIFTSLYKQLDLNYVDEIKPGELMKTGIDAMLNSLDPYTNYIPESEIEDYRFMTTGEYGGIGAQIHKNGLNIVISDVYEGSPADKAGIVPGDIVLEINHKQLSDKNEDEVSMIMKGQPGSNCLLLLKREGEPGTFEKTVPRENIKVDNVPFSGMLNDHAGYIKLSGFPQDVSREVKKAFEGLKSKNSLKGLVFDLRGNGGGLLNEAVNIANIFIEKGQLIVKTKGKLESSNNAYSTVMSPVDLDIPVVFLVDKNSASASEILAGAMQDLDRAVILGQRSYGKGLVQNVLPLSYNAQVKVTVAKYYIPSGRCIQAIDYSHKDEEGNFMRIPDSLIHAFSTKNNRTVYDGGGIEPDVVMEPPKYAAITLNLVNKFLVFDFATRYRKQNPSIANARDFKVDDALYAEFIRYLDGKDFNYETRSEKALQEMEKNAVKEKYFEDIKPEFEALKTKMTHNKQEDLEKFSDEIRDILRLEIVGRYYYQKGRVEAALDNDPEIRKAIGLIDDTEAYKSILAGNRKISEKGSR